MTKTYYIVPDYYLAPLRRPSSPTGYISPEQVAWDMCDHWQTAAEWLAWIRRKDGKPRYWGKGQKWHYPMRPIITAQRNPTSTMRRSKLP